MSAYDEGFRARLHGEKATSNPYRKWSEKWLEWADGWKDQDHHLNERDEALRSIGWPMTGGWSR